MIRANEFDDYPIPTPKHENLTKEEMEQRRIEAQANLDKVIQEILEKHK